ncbi:hypothetical protein K0M31_002963, partial [Melipona bicolor]
FPAVLRLPSFPSEIRRECRSGNGPFPSLTFPSQQGEEGAEKLLARFGTPVGEISASVVIPEMLGRLALSRDVCRDIERYESDARRIRLTTLTL